MDDTKRAYRKSHPWLTFEIDLRRAPAELWIMLGECQSKCEHIAGTPLRPDVNRELHEVYLAKGVAATTAIEGNTLSEEQVRLQMAGKLTVPPSKSYLQQEVENILRGCNLILEEIKAGTLPELSVARIKKLNGVVLDTLTLDNDRAVPGELRDHSVGVMDYRGTPAADCEYLVRRLCEWLGSLPAKAGSETVTAILKAVLAHLYLAWIHPFGDGNGRTARLLEVQILLCAGVPSPAAQLLSNHYNQTRTEYYRQLARASRSGGDAISFLLYAVEGLRDGLREQIQRIRDLQWDLAWRDYVHDAFRIPTSEIGARQMRLVLELTAHPGGVDVDSIVRLSGTTAADYAAKTPKTLSRDLHALEEMQLIRQEGKRVYANKEIILAFLPARARTSAS
jgi:Fic family protein